MSSTEIFPTIGRPRPLMKRSKSLSTSTSSGRRRSTTPSASTRPNSNASGSTAGSSSGSSVMRSIVRILNTPLSELNTPPPPKKRSSLSESSSGFTRFLRSEEKQKAVKPQLKAKLGSTESLRATTMSLLSNYSAFRSSIMSSSSSGRSKEEILASAQRYYTSMCGYLSQVDDLPPSVRDTLEVKRLRQQLEFTVELLQPVIDEAPSEQTILLLDNTLMLVKSLLSDVQYLLLQQTNRPLPAAEEDEHEEEEGNNFCEDDGMYEYDIPQAHLAILISEPDPEPECSSLRRVRTMAVLKGSSLQDEPARDSGYGTGEGSQQDPCSNEHHTPRRRVRFTLQESRTQETLADVSKNIEDVADSLTAINACPLFTEAARSQTPQPVNKPDDTIDVTYGQDGIPVAMSAAAIIEQLIKDLGFVPSKGEAPTGNFSDIIFTSFRFFWSPEEFLGYLEAAYDDSYFNDRKLSIVLLVRTWVLAYWLPQDSQARGLIKKVHRFLGRALTDGLVCASIIIDILARLEEYSKDTRRSAIVREVPEMEFEAMPFSFVDISRDMPLLRGNYHNIRIMEFDSSGGCLEFARQMTLKESGLYLQLTAREVISCFVVGDDQNEEAAIAKGKMRDLRDFSCTVKRWAAWNVLKRSTSLKRARAFGFMMRLAKALLGIRNFSSAHSIYNGALSVHLDMLIQMEAELTPKARRNMSYVTGFFDENRDISMQSSAEPTVPITATYAGKLSRLLEFKGIMTPSKVDKSVQLVNISFFKAATRITYAMESNQHPYKFKAHAPLQRFIDYNFKQVPSEDEIHELYLKVKTEEQSGEHPLKPGLMNRLRTNSAMAIHKF